MTVLVVPLLVAGSAVLVWPGRAATRRARLRRLRGSASPVLRSDLLAAVPVRVVVPAAALAAGVLAAVWSTPLVAGLTAVVVASAGRAALGRRSERRMAVGLRALAEALGVLAAEIRAGRPTRGALGTALAACPDVATAAALRARLAAPGERTAGRKGNELAAALDRVVAATELSLRTGCSLGAVVSAVEDDLRARVAAAEELRSAVAGPRASATVLAGLPVLGLLMGAGVGADPWGVLTGTPLGQSLLVAGVVLELAGLSWSARLVARAVR